MVFSRPLRRADRFDSEEFRRVVQLGIDRGLVRRPDEAQPIAKDGAAAASLGEVRTQWMEVDSATAQRWLENNFRNRPLVEDVVTAYARDMVNGVWVATHQGVAFNDRDELIDGQHRLTAIVRSGVTVRMMVTFGLPAAIEGSEMTTMDAVDRGRTRSVADQLKIQHGMKDGALISALTTGLGHLCWGERTRRLSVGQTLEIYRAFQPAVDWLLAMRTKRLGLRVNGVLVGFAFAMTATGELERLGAQYSALTAENEAFPPGSPLGHLRFFLLSPEAKLLNRGADRGVAELVLQALYLEQLGQPVEQVELAPAGLEYFREKHAERVRKIAGMFRLPGKEGC